MIVVSDTSPLVCLAHLNHLDLLASLFVETVVPAAVSEEFDRFRGGCFRGRLGAAKGLRFASPSSTETVERFRRRVDFGEAQALALALELKPDAVLIDEWAARSVARELGIPIFGTLAVLMRAKESGLIAFVMPLVDRLRSELNFFVSRRLYDEVAKKTGEAAPD